MKVLLMHRDQDFDPRQLLRHWPTYRSGDADPRQQLLPHERALIQDLELDTLLAAMAARDEFLFKVADQALRAAFQNDLDTILYRQGILKDSVQNPEVIRQLYDLAVEA